MGLRQKFMRPSIPALCLWQGRHCAGTRLVFWLLLGRQSLSTFAYPGHAGAVRAVQGAGRAAHAGPGALPAAPVTHGG